MFTHTYHVLSWKQVLWVESAGHLVMDEQEVPRVEEK